MSTTYSLGFSKSGWWMLVSMGISVSFLHGDIFCWANPRSKNMGPTYGAINQCLVHGHGEVHQRSEKVKGPNMCRPRFPVGALWNSVKPCIWWSGKQPLEKLTLTSHNQEHHAFPKKRHGLTHGIMKNSAKSERLWTANSPTFVEHFLPSRSSKPT